ncbi:Stk1 family PASTA domain-containing Ser/Thr kinase [Nocardia shimofusensis]|uniref:Stk1 family PASTA domain-containing Ser/Thr kinase n=1 Tax=Nocardia shimofusensis TaxID=228596 RepID=UPI000A8DCE4D|nr:Stk1 family PASTA domain-containing Ser/Thr kinase [Nocardia shimofusensis]
MIGQMLDGRYRIDAPIARGGMSTVFRGVDTRLDRPVAIKVMDPKFAGDPQFLTRFELEARTVARLSHPALVAVYDQGIDGEYPFLIMELVQGGTLRELLRERGPMPPHAARAVVEPVLAAIGVAHNQGLVHRDIKPENVLISDAGEVKIADFGLVRAVAAANTTAAGVILGTAAYLSPEQVTTGHTDARSDVYAFGILLFELLTGQVPFTGDNSLSVALQRVDNDVPSPSSYIDGVPAEFDELVARATAREPAHRFANADEMLAELRHIAVLLNLPPYRVPAPQDSAEHLSARHRAADLTPAAYAPPPAQPPQHHPTRVVTGPQPHQDDYAPADYAPADYAPDAYTHNEYAQHRQPAAPHYEPAGAHAPYRAAQANSRRTTLIWVAVVAVLTLLVGIGGWWLGVGRYSAVPPIAGLTAEQATEAVIEAGFTAETKPKASDTVPVGGVVGSDPPAGAKITKGSTVSVLVSNGKPKVPAVQPGDDIATVISQIEDAGLTPVRAGETGSTAPEGTLAKVEPAPGTVLPLNGQVKVYTSNGSQPVQVPDVRGKTVEEAEAALAAVGITVRSTTESYDKTIEAGSVISTDPVEGTTIDPGQGVSLVVSNAVKIPGVIGKSVADAREILEGLGLQVQVRQLTPRDSSVVISQSPTIAAKVQPGSTVTLVALP